MKNFEKTNEGFRRPEKPDEKLTRLLGEISARQNLEQGFSAGKPLFNSDCAINMDAFGFADMEEDKELIRQKEIEWSGAENENVRDFYKKEFSAETDEEIVRQYKINKEKNANSRLEKSLACVFHKILGGEFIVARASTHDDYFNGIDTVLVDKETGDVICALDEVHDEEGRSRHEKKIESIKKAAKRGGAEIKYGITFEKDEETGASKLIQKTIKNIPKFYLRLSNKELYGLLEGMTYGVDDNPAEIELEIFDALLESLAEQRNLLLGENIKDNRVREKIENFEISLNKMREIRKENFTTSLAA